MSIDDVSARHSSDALSRESHNRPRPYFEDKSAVSSLLGLATELVFTADRLTTKSQATGQNLLCEKAQELYILAVKLHCQALGIKGVADGENP